MRDSPYPLLLWVLVPVTVMVWITHALVLHETDTLNQRSTRRAGRMGIQLLAGEMGRATTALAEQATVRTGPAMESPLVQAASEGDTVAALGSSTEGLTLSLALAERSGDSMEIRVATAPFQPTSLDLLRGRGGLGAALFLRGKKVGASPGDFGPGTLSGMPGTSPDSPNLPRGSLILPFGGPKEGPAPAQLLVGPLAPPAGGLPTWLPILVTLLAWVVAGGTWLQPRTGDGRQSGRLRILLSGVAPVLCLWVLVGAEAQHIDRSSSDLLRRDLVRILALAGEADPAPSVDEISRATGFHAVREEGGAVTATTLPAGPESTALAGVAIPESGFPTLGRVEMRGSAVVYAGLRDSPSSEILIAAPARGEMSSGFRFLLVVPASLASLLALGFLAGNSGKGARTARA